MPDYASSTQNEKWLYTPEILAEVRSRANREVRRALSADPDGSSGGGGGGGGAAGTDGGAESGGASKNGGGSGKAPVVPARWYASGYAAARAAGRVRIDDEYDDPGWESSPSRGCQPLLDPEDEGRLIQFYAGKMHDLIGPSAQVPRLRRDEKVAATAALLFRRFFLSNSVMIHDPKAILVAAAFLGSKVEDATADVRYLEEGTKLMQAPVPAQDIIDAEIHLLAGVNFELMCYHPYKTVLAYTEDLRTYLKSERGWSLASFPDGSSRPVAGEDLRPMHDMARKIVLDAVVSDVPLLYSPGQIGLAAMMVANEDLRSDPSVPYIDLMGYVRARFEDRSKKEHALLSERMAELCGMLRGLAEGGLGCGNHGIDMGKLKAVHKKLKKCRAWGGGGGGGGADNGDGGKKKKKKKKRKAEEGEEGGDDEPEVKKVKLEE